MAVRPSALPSAKAQHVPHCSRSREQSKELPAPVAAVIFAVQYRQGQREMASVVLFSSVGSLLTLAAFIALT